MADPKEEPKVEPEVEPEKPQEDPKDKAPEDKEPEEELEPEEDPDLPENPPDPEEKPPSRRESLRIKALVEKLKIAEGRAEQPAPTTTTPPASPGALDYAKSLEADPETIKQLEADRKAYGDTAYERGLAQAKSIQFHTRLEIDAPAVTARYPQLDKSSPQFNPVATDAINQWYLSTVGYDQKTDTVRNADVRYAEFVDGVMELADEMAGEKVAKSTKNIAKQASNTGLRPGGATPKRMNLRQAPENMTDEELDAVIEMAIPSKPRR